MVLFTHPVTTLLDHISCQKLIVDIWDIKLDPFWVAVGTSVPFPLISEMLLQDLGGEGFLEHAQPGSHGTSLTPKWQENHTVAGTTALF